MAPSSVEVNMLGAIAGDMIGSVYEHAALQTEQFPLFSPRSRFTDDTVLTIATAHEAYHSFGRRYPYAGYGGSFRTWLRDNARQPYGRWGNGAAMRVSPIGLTAESAGAALAEAERSASVAHDHPEGIRGAQAVALAVCPARIGEPKETLRREVVDRLDYDLSRTLHEIRLSYRFDVSCQGSVPEALIAFLDAHNLENAIRFSVSLGGDADTQASIAGAVAEAFWGAVPDAMTTQVLTRLPAELREITCTFREKYPLRRARGT